MIYLYVLYCIVYIHYILSFRQNRIRQSFSRSQTYQKIPCQDQIVLSAANSFKLMTLFFNS